MSLVILVYYLIMFAFKDYLTVIYCLVLGLGIYAFGPIVSLEIYIAAFCSSAVTDLAL